MGIELGVIGTGWIGGIRATTGARHALVNRLHIADADPDVAAAVAQEVGAATATSDYRELLDRDEVAAVIVSTTPEATHFPIARDALRAGKHVLMEKPMALALAEADELIELASSTRLKLTVGYTLRFKPKYAYVKQCVVDGTLGEPVAGFVNRSITRAIGSKILNRVKLGPAQLVATHDIDFLLWCMDAARPQRVYAQAAAKVMAAEHGLPDSVWILVTMDDGSTITIGSSWILPPATPRYSGALIELLGTRGGVSVDDTHRDVLLSTLERDLVRPLSSFPGEQLMHIFQGPMEVETRHFVEAVALDRPVLVRPEEARRVMEVTLAADRSIEDGQPVELPLRS